MPEDPLDVVVPPPRWPAELQEQLTRDLVAAAVMIPIIHRKESLSVLLTERSPDLKHHAGQISFPGGRMEEHDADVRETALRETHEEVGIAPEQVDVIGYLRTMPTITGFAVTPVVGLIRPDVDVVIDRTEVEYAFEVPLDFLLTESNARLVDREWEGRKFRLKEFHYDGERVWGATAYMILAFQQFVLNQ